MNELLINQETGEPDVGFILREARQQARLDWGGDNYPDHYLRSRVQNLKARAEIMRKRWRLVRNLPDDTPTTMTQVASWGASGDSFGRGR